MILDLLLDEDDADTVGVDEAAFLTVLGIIEVTPPPPEVVVVDDAVIEKAATYASQVDGIRAVLSRFN